MATFKQNNIEFTANNVNYEWNGNSGNSDNGDFSTQGDGKLPIAPFVNAVEIDWNSAIIGEG